MNLKIYLKNFGKRFVASFVGFVLAVFFGILEFTPRHSWMELTYVDKILGSLYFAFVFALIWSLGSWVLSMMGDSVSE